MFKQITVLGVLVAFMVGSQVVVAADKKEEGKLSSSQATKEEAQTEASEAKSDLSKPDEVIKQLSGKMLERIKTDSGEPRPIKELHDIIKEVLMPHIAEQTVARRVLSKHWKNATDEQKEKFTKEFSTFLILFYAKAFSQYTDEVIDYKPLKEKEINGKRAEVETLIRRKDGAPIDVKYRMKKYKSGEWKVVDIVVEGVSLVYSKNKEYNPLVAAESWDTVTAKLAFKNQQALQ